MISEYLDAVKNKTNQSYVMTISRMLIFAFQHDSESIGGKFSVKASERKAARRAERKAAEAASPAQQPQADDDGERVWRTGEEWTSSDDFKQVAAQVKEFWTAADYDGRIRIHKMWMDVMEDEQAATDYLHTLQKAG